MEKSYRLVPPLLIFFYMIFIYDNESISFEAQMIVLAIFFALSAFCIAKLIMSGHLKGVRLVVFSSFLLLLVAISGYYVLLSRG
jgi:hypothetical protein